MNTVFHKKEQGIRSICNTKLILKILAALSILLLAVFTRIPENMKGYVYNVSREVIKVSSLINTRELINLEGENFVVKYPADVNEADAKLVLNTAEKFFAPISEDLQFTMQKKIPIVIYSSKEKLNKYFGWPASESAMGVYWAGVIRILSPRVWIQEGEPSRLEEIFVSSGPMAHEYAHLVVDYKTRGNYPRWFTEGVAQYEEYKLTGFRFTEAYGSLDQQLYSFDSLGENFDYVPNQSLAYRQSFAAVKFLVDNYGENSILQIIDYLASGKSMDESLKRSIGKDIKGFEEEWRRWVSINIDEFN